MKLHWLGRGTVDRAPPIPLFVSSFVWHLSISPCWRPFPFGVLGLGVGPRRLSPRPTVAAAAALRYQPHCSGPAATPAWRPMPPPPCRPQVLRPASSKRSCAMAQISQPFSGAGPASSRRACSCVATQYQFDDPLANGQTTASRTCPPSAWTAAWCSAMRASLAATTCRPWSPAPSTPHALP